MLSMAQRQNYIYFFMSLIIAIATVMIYWETKPQWLLFREAENKFEQKAFAAAIPLYLESMKAGNSSFEAVLHLADAYVAMGDFPQAIRWYKVALEKQNNRYDIRFKLGETLIWNNNFEEAEEEFKKLEAINDSKKNE